MPQWIGSRFRPKRFSLDSFIAIAAIALLFANITLLRRDHALQAVSTPNETSRIVEGKHLERGLAASTLDNVFRPISFSPTEPDHTLLITFSPLCPHCRANHNNWLAIATGLRRKGGWRVLWVSRDPVGPTRDYCEDSAIPINETFADPAYRTYMALDLNVVPYTVVLDKRGVVQKLWRGELDNRTWKQVFSYLGVPLV